MRCVTNWELIEHSGVGYAFHAYLEGLSVHFVPSVARPNNIATIWDDRVFHLGGGLKFLPPAAGSQMYRSVLGALLDASTTLARAVLPKRARLALRRQVGTEALSRYHERRGEAIRVRVRKEMGNALDNPDEYLAGLLNLSSSVRPTS